MRILHVISTLAPSSGGPTQVTISLAKAQSDAGHQVTVCTTDRGNPVQEKLPESYFRTLLTLLVKFEVFRVTYAPLLMSFHLAQWLRKNIRAFDIVHIHGLYRFPVTFAAWLARKKGIPYIIRPHGSLDPFLYGQSRYGQWAVPVKRTYERLFDIPNLNHAAAIHYTAQEEMERAAFLKLKAPAVIVPNGIEWEEYAKLPQPGAFRSLIGVKTTVPLVLFLGRVNFKKGLDLLVPAFAKVVKTISDVRLAIVGPDNEGYGKKVRGWCREHGIADKVCFVGRLGPEKVKQAYVDADVFVLPSYTENFGMTVVEAMACACPVIISDQVNIWREVKAAGAGLVTRTDVNEIAEAIRSLLLNKEKALTMGLKGRAAAREKYAWPAIVQQLTNIYRQLIAKAGAKSRH